MDTLALPFGGKSWSSSRGQLGLWVPHPQILVISLKGHGEVEFVPAILQAYELLLGSGLLLFTDMERIERYESGLRVELTARFGADRSRIASIPVLGRSPLVTMGVTVANLALGGLIEVTAERREFAQKLDEALQMRRVVGFESSELERF